MDKKMSRRTQDDGHGGIRWRQPAKGRCDRDVFVVWQGYNTRKIVPNGK